MTSQKDLPTEILARILAHLPYKDLLHVLAVGAEWNRVATSDPAIGVLLFKVPSEVYVESSSGPEPQFSQSTEEEEPEKSQEPADPDQVRLHPALSTVSFKLGNALSDAYFFLPDGRELLLSDSAVPNDFASIPMVTTFAIDIEENFEEALSFKVEVENSAGVKVIDIFEELVTASKRKVDTERSMVEALGDHTFYEGFTATSRTGKRLTTWLRLGS
ncbi:hypothetical protein C8J57DRAFT_1276981 [Mycena rebaudengoi]|nr:hypothetical protein C8J57DRAFT_1276981 [Mycena rebaudengoi]